MNDIRRIIGNRCRNFCGCDKINRNALIQNLDNMAQYLIEDFNCCQNNYFNTHTQHRCNHCTCNNEYDRYRDYAQVSLQNDENVTIDPSIAADAFLSEYYRGVSYVGFSDVMHLFDSECVVIFKDKYIGNSYNLLTLCAKEAVKRAVYSNLSNKWFVLDNETLIINVFGLMQFVGYNEYVGKSVYFTETFVLKVENNKIKCVNHMLDF